MSQSEKNRIRTVQELDPIAEDALAIQDEDYVDWDKRGRAVLKTPSEKSKFLAFGIPFVVVFLAILAISSISSKPKVIPNNPSQTSTTKVQDADSLTSSDDAINVESATSELGLSDHDALTQDIPAQPEGSLPAAQESQVEVNVEKREEVAADAPVDPELHVEIDHLDSPELAIPTDEQLLDLDEELIGDLGDESAATLAEEEEPMIQPVDIEALRANLAQIEFLFQQIKAENATDANALLLALDEPLNATSTFLETSPQELVDEASALQSRILNLQNVLRDGSEYFAELYELDEASLDVEATRDFFNSLPIDGKSLDAEIFAQYDAELERSAQTLDALDCVNEWNLFVQEYGERLEKFQVAKEDVAVGLAFINDALNKPGLPEEAANLAKRKAQWQFEATHDFPTQRKIVLMLESEIRQQYWTYSPSRNKIYYLPDPPRAGMNRYVSSAAGTVGTIEIPADAPELALEISPQKRALNELAKLAWNIPDSLRNDDVAQWYSKWAEFLRMIQDSNDLDPILQYKYFKEASQHLKGSDYYFSNQLDAILRVLNAPQLDDKNSIDRFKTESDEIVALRNLALSRLQFLPKDALNVAKTTAELNAKSPRFVTLYNRVGWLDRSFNDEWVLRRPLDSETPNGDLFVLYLDEEDASTKWFKIGSADGKQVSLNIASNAIPRGSVVLCRVAMNVRTAVAARSSVDALFKR